MISVVMPAHNEEGYLETAVEMTVSGLRDRGLEFELIVSENGSTDATTVTATALAKTYDEVRVLTSPIADYGRALRVGFLDTRGQSVVNFDVDLVDLDFLERALALIDDSGADIVVGSKRGPGADDQRVFGRRAVTAVFSGILRYGFGLKISDTHGLKALRRSRALPLVEASLFEGDIFDTELVLRAEKAGLSVMQIPITVAERRPARTPIARRIPRTLLGLARLRLALWRHPT